MKFFNFLKKTPKQMGFGLLNALSINPAHRPLAEKYRWNNQTDDYFDEIIEKVRGIAINNALISGYLEHTLPGFVLGKNGMNLDITTKNAKLNKQIEREFYLWKQQKHPRGVRFREIEREVLTNLIRDGEAFIRIHRQKGALRLEVLDCLDIDSRYHDPAKNIYRGITYNSKGEPLSYHFFDKTSHHGREEEIKADEIIHLFRRQFPKQIRGFSSLASVVILAAASWEYKQAELDLARLKASITGFITNDSDYSEAQLSFDTADDEAQPKPKVSQISAQVGKMSVIDAGLKPQFVETHNPTNIEFFIKQTNMEIARALGVSYGTFLGDMREANYSSMRYGAVIEKKTFEYLQNYLVCNFYDPIFELWLKFECAFKLPIADFDEVIYKSDFKPQGFEHIDPQKETKANAEAIKSGQKSIVEVLRERGKDLDIHLDELRVDAAIRELLPKTTQFNPTKE